ncbi:MAG: hypothetical protein AAF265_14880 [Pseudomonadota bacterium]
MRFFSIVFVFWLAGCTSAPPTVPPEYSEPPAVATDGFVTVVASTDVPLSLSEFRDYLLENPFIDYLEPTDNIAPPKSWVPLKGEWLTPGASRRMQLADGHYVIERVLENNPELFRYQVWVFTNGAGRGIEQIVGEQRFTALSPTLTRFEWRYNVKPTSWFTRIFVKRRVPELQTFMDTGVRNLNAAIDSGTDGG